MELRLGILLRNGNDALVFEQTLKFMPKLTRLSHDLPDCIDAGICCISKTNLPRGIKTLGLRVREGPFVSNLIGLIDRAFNFSVGTLFREKASVWSSHRASI